MRLILSDFFTDGKNVVFSIVKPFDKLFRTAQINKWCALLCDYVRALHTAHRKRPAPPPILRRTFPALRFRTENYDDYKQLEYKQGKAFENV